MDVPTQLEFYLYNQLDIATVACYLLPYFLLQSLANYFLLKFSISSLFTFYYTIGPHLSALRLKT